MLDYYHNIFQSKFSNADSIIHCIPCLVDVADNEMLCGPYSDEEVKLALFYMKPDKSRGLNGFKPGFSQAY